MKSFKSIINENSEDDIGWNTMNHPNQSWEAVSSVALNYGLDTTNPMHILWARLFANDVIRGKNQYNHPILQQTVLNDLAENAQVFCEDGCYDLHRLHKCKSCQSKELLVAYSYRFISKQVSRYAFATASGFDREDLIQSGYVGLLHALETWEPDGGMDFLGWSQYFIKQELRMLITNDGLLLRIPFQKKILQSRLPTIRAELRDQLDRDPSYSEMSFYIRAQGYDKGCGTKLIPPGELAFLESFQMQSLNQTIETDDGGTMELLDLIPSPIKDPAKEVEMRDLMERLLSSLPENEEIVLRNYQKGLGSCSAEEVVKLLPVSPTTGKPYTESSVSTMLDRARDRMRFELISMGFADLGAVLE